MKTKKIKKKPKFFKKEEKKIEIQYLEIIDFSSIPKNDMGREGQFLSRIFLVISHSLRFTQKKKKNNH